MGQMILDWKSIRPLNGSRDKGFEELCAQLARAECPMGSQFVRKGTPDAGVECYAVLSDGSEWGWQSKYFDGLGDSQWSQLDKSVGTAIEKHPRLVRYFVCVPLDRPDARIAERKSAKERWDEHVKKWTQWATNKKMAVEFVYWGSHELLARLAGSKHVGRVRFWFDVRGFDRAWFSARLEEALKTAGPRYTPEIHVDLPIAKEFEAFGRTDIFFDWVKAHARTIREKLRSVEYIDPNAPRLPADFSTAALSSRVQTVLGALSKVDAQPIGTLPLKEIADQAFSAEATCNELAQLLLAREKESESQAAGDAERGARYHRLKLFRDLRIRLHDLSFELTKVREALVHGADIAGSVLIILRGVAGTGKTHLLCDVARQRVEVGKPTVLLMGQRFTSNEAPWIQALQQLDMVELAAEEFVGALEAAAQAAGTRALLIIDAINEGNGRIIWPGHLASFLACIERSPWIGVVLAVRLSYEEHLVPAEVRRRAVSLTHEGFAEHEYDATKNFFVYYGLELPSTPLLAPEFRNPLFLKTLCHGLNAMGERRLPRGLHGITAVFELYLSAVNERLATSIDFNPKAPLVRRALDAFSETLLDSGERWLSLAKAEEIINAFLPGRDFERSLYRGLIVEGVLLEEAARGPQCEEVVYVSYDRFADHLTAKALLDRDIDNADPASAFAQGGPLAFLCDVDHCITPGFLEALCIQIPERTGLELVALAPTCTERWGFSDAFRQSLIWRAYTAFSEGTYEALDNLTRSKHDLHDTIGVLLTVSTLPGHPLNATFLDRRLRKDGMPDRDAWWSIYLHHAWGTHGAIDRLVDWASSLTPNASIDDETVDLCATSLAWMLTTSNRFLRDRATKALVSLLTGRLAAVIRLVERFAKVDDPYVAERVYAVAYGISTRCHDPAEVGNLAICVYDCVFATEGPPPHILLRDYARGVVERALYLGAADQVVADRIRPPYHSRWPKIPTKNEIELLLREHSGLPPGSGAYERSGSTIRYSVLNGDFARYIIGTNSSSTSSDWLCLRLEDPSWVPPARPEDRLRSLVGELSTDELRAWEEFQAVDQAYAEAFQSFFYGWFQSRTGGAPASTFSDLVLDLDIAYPPEVRALKQRREEAFAVLEASFTAEHRLRFNAIEASKGDMSDAGRPPGFDLGQIQRYVLWRVFDLGWTAERFGHFDNYEIRAYERHMKAERIGKKYQWIAYHEILALVADHFQFLERSQGHEGKESYNGPWQIFVRDIDPSCTIAAPRGGTSWNGHAVAWWGPVQYDRWGDPESQLEWVLSRNDLPNVEALLMVVNPADETRWLNGQGHFHWMKPPPPDKDLTDVERREIWYTCTGYLVREADAGAFLEWAEGVDFWGRWMPDAPKVYRMFLGEHAWAPAARYFQHQYYGDDGWTQPDYGCPVKIRATAVEYFQESSGLDCSIDGSYQLSLPAGELVTGLGIRWNGTGADFLDPAGRVAAKDPTVHAKGPNSLLFREDLLVEYLAREKLTFCWAVLGEKFVLSPSSGTDTYYPRLQVSGAYVLSGAGPVGFVKHMRSSGDRESAPQIIGVTRTGPDLKRRLRNSRHSPRRR